MLGPAAVDARQQLAFRPLQPGDMEELKKLHGELFPIDYDNGFFEKAVNSLDRLFSYAAVYHSNSGKQQMVGFITARLMYAYECDPLDRHYLGFGSPGLASTPLVYILTLGVTKAWQGQGVGRLLLQQVHSHAQAMRWKAVFLHVITYNQAALRLYSSQSYRCLACLQNFYTISTGRQPDPSRTSYDAYLYGVLLPEAEQLADSLLPWHQGAAAWNMAMAPLRNVLGHFNNCMPWLCSPGYNSWLGPGCSAPQQGASHPASAAQHLTGPFAQHSLAARHDDTCHGGTVHGRRSPQLGASADAPSGHSSLMANWQRSRQDGSNSHLHLRSHLQRRLTGSAGSSGALGAMDSDSWLGRPGSPHGFEQVGAGPQEEPGVGSSSSLGSSSFPAAGQACAQQHASSVPMYQQQMSARVQKPVGSQSLLQWLTLPSR